MLPNAVPRVRERPLHSLLKASVPTGNKASQTCGCRKRCHKDTISYHSFFYIDKCFIRLLFYWLTLSNVNVWFIVVLGLLGSVPSIIVLFSFDEFFLSSDKFSDKRFCCFMFRILLSHDVPHFLHTFHETLYYNVTRVRSNIYMFSLFVFPFFLFVVLPLKVIIVKFNVQHFHLKYVYIR